MHACTHFWHICMLRQVLGKFMHASMYAFAHVCMPHRVDVKRIGTLVCFGKNYFKQCQVTTEIQCHNKHIYILLFVKIFFLNIPALIWPSSKFYVYTSYPYASPEMAALLLLHKSAAYIPTKAIGKEGLETRTARVLCLQSTSATEDSQTT